MVQFSKESNNLHNLNSFKYSDLGVSFATTKSKKQNQPSKIQHKAVMNKEFTKMAKLLLIR
ncbi:hypothetical protein ACHQM5_003511 [Ranunculus cassubicifolius]